jgi:branched-chain amino acid transport system ATP-binding protein
MSVPLLSVSGLNTAYDQSQILRDVAFTVEPAETIGLLGRNGMGKTTLLRTLIGLLDGGTSAAIQLAGQEATRLRAAQRSRLGLALVPEGRGIFPNLTVEENLIFAARKGAKGQAWTAERLSDLFPRLAERRRNFGDQLSGGEQQMLSIGRALLTNPSLLMLDEATEGLAPKIRDEIWAMLGLVAKEGISLIVVDKNLDDLFALADRHLILAKGEIVFSGTTQALKNNEELIHRHLGV